MRRTTKPDVNRGPIGAYVDQALWTEIRMVALRQGRNAGEVLDDAMRDYLAKQKAAAV